MFQIGFGELNVGRAILPADALSGASKPAGKPAAAKNGRPTRWHSYFLTDPLIGPDAYFLPLSCHCVNGERTPRTFTFKQ
jgi:hypothetical protein